MFRNPRENAVLPPNNRLDPSVGRPPSPPRTLRRERKTSAQDNSAMPSKTTSTRNNTKTLSTPVKLSQSTLIPAKSAKKSSSTVTNNKGKAKPNGNILTFFKKAEEEKNTLFIKEKPSIFSNGRQRAHSPEDIYDDYSPAKETAVEESERYNESGGSVKRRKLSDVSGESITEPLPANGEENEIPEKDEGEQIEGGKPENIPTTNKRRGPFIDDSDSDSDQEALERIRRRPAFPRPESAEQKKHSDDNDPTATDLQDEDVLKDPPELKRETTSFPEENDLNGFEGFEDLEDYDDEDFNEGEENVERRWMEEQRLLELAEGSFEGPIEESGICSQAPDPVNQSKRDGSAESPKCPVCNIDMDGILDSEVAIHVNNCLDGNPSPLPQQIAKPTTPIVKAEKGRQFQRPIQPPKPGQENPFVLGAASTGSSSAFSKLMSGHAEDAAWATAAASEKQSRGQPAYKRTCPFYKILPGFFICVDAFRYGTVQDCQAYFLSHFHSDHYIGLTASWSHGPIYCSKVTANLVRQQLRVAAKYVIALDFEQRVEVPGTKGVYVTMIPANHCPGSSLFLYEKVIGKGKNPRTQRVLHCGDFRACGAHLEHPLLRPDVMDTVTNKTRQQKIDVCYLDTTYLNPKYAFPPQGDVIKACADMCVSLSKERRDENDSWEQMKKSRARQGMVNFVQTNDETAKPEAIATDDDVNAMAVSASTKEGKQRGRLLVVVGTYSIGKERICLGIARALNSKIYAPPAKQKICAALEDPELNELLTTDPREAQVHMTPLFEIRADTLDEYLVTYGGHFTRAVGFRPSGWNYRPPNSRFVESPSIQTVLHSANWKSTYSMKELVPQRGSTNRASCFGVPYSEHSSFRELTMFCCALRIDKIIPTVNIASPKSREKMKGWCDKWAAEKKKNGLFKPDESTAW